MYVLPYGQMSLWGECYCPKCNEYDCFIFTSIVFISVYLNLTIDVVAKRIRAESRVGPHNKDIISILYGSLLGDCHAENRITGSGTRFSFSQESNRQQYLLWLHNLIATMGYCNPTVPVIQTRMGIGGKVRYVIRFHTFTYSSLNWIHNAWYINGIKRVPKDISEYLTPLAIAIWIMDDGSRVGAGIKWSTNSFAYQDCLLLCKVLSDIYGLKTSVQSAGYPNQYVVYVFKESMPLLRTIVSPYMVSSMLYKLGTLHCINKTIQFVV